MARSIPSVEGRSELLELRAKTREVGRCRFFYSGYVLLSDFSERKHHSKTNLCCAFRCLVLGLLNRFLFNPFKRFLS